MGSLKFLNQKDVLNVVLARETVQQWLYSYKSVKVAVVYGTHEHVLKIQTVIVVVAK
jgi:hypothetical protein